MQELALAQRDFAVVPKTIYIGGGTPSINKGSVLKTLIPKLNKTFSQETLTEFTVEINPEDISKDLLFWLQAHGVTRLSVGVQNTFTSMLFNLGRPFERPLRDRFDLLKRAWPGRLNLDLMFAIPGLTTAILKQTLQDILTLDPGHLSTYELTLPRTHRSTRFGPSEDTLLHQFEIIESTLKAAGYTRYEVSNFARLDHESKHNMKYWQFESILGLGVSAHSSITYTDSQGPIQCKQWTNPKTFTGYQSLLKEAQHPLANTPLESDTHTKQLFLIAHLRKHSGLSVQTYEQAFQESFESRFKPALVRLLAQHLLICRNGSLSPTPQGMLILDSLLKELFSCLDSE